jgi:hypothetical protein
LIAGLFGGFECHFERGIGDYIVDGHVGGRGAWVRDCQKCHSWPGSGLDPKSLGSLMVDRDEMELKTPASLFIGCQKGTPFRPRGSKLFQFNTFPAYSNFSLTTSQIPYSTIYHNASRSAPYKTHRPNFGRRLEPTSSHRCCPSYATPHNRPSNKQQGGGQWSQSC